MTVFELGAIGEFVGAIAVVATLIYLSLQIRQNTAATRAQIHQARSDQAQRYFEFLASSDELIDIFSLLEKDGRLTPERLSELDAHALRRLRMFSAMSIGRLENAHYQHANGFLDDEIYESMMLSQVQRFGPLWTVLGIDLTLPASFRQELRQRISNLPG